MRGKGYTTAAESEENRITPAYAGKSLYNTSNAICIQDHPRLCGEKRQPEHTGGHLIGSPPPMRGKALLQDFCKRRVRITPAYAGKSGTTGLCKTS